MKFNGSVGDLGSKEGSKVGYEIKYRGSDKVKLLRYVEGEVKRKGLLLLNGLGVSKEGDVYVCSGMVSSSRGIV